MEIKRKTILIVDDTPENISILSTVLKMLYKTKIATTGQLALEIATSDTPPDLILLDIVMPEMDGFEVCKRLKENPKTRDIPVIFLTGRTDPQDEKQGLELGAVDYITKPISPPIVMMRVRTQLQLRRCRELMRGEEMAIASVE